MIDSSRRTILTTGAAAAAATAAPQVFAQAPQATAPQMLPAGAKIGFYEKGGVRIRYGVKAEKLAEFGIQPRRPADRSKTDPSKKKPSEPGPNPAQTAAPGTEAST